MRCPLWGTENPSIIDWGWPTIAIQVPFDDPPSSAYLIRFKQELFTIEKDKDMPYVDTLTRMSLQEGRQEGREEGSLAQARESVIEALEIRFGEVSTDLRERITALDNLRTLKAQHRRAITVPSLEQF